MVFNLSDLMIFSQIYDTMSAIEALYIFDQYKYVGWLFT